MKILKNIINSIIDFLMVIVIIFAIGITLISLNSDNNEVSRIGKYIPFNVKTNSMEPTIMEGDFIVMEECDSNNLEVGDVISFFATEQDKVIVKTHRIVSINETGGDKSYITRGDNNPANDEIPVFPLDIIGKWNGIKVSKVGTILDFVSSQTGFLICIVFPLLVLFIYQIYRFIVVIIEEKNASVMKNNQAILEAAAKIKEEEAKKNSNVESNNDKLKKE